MKNLSKENLVLIYNYLIDEEKEVPHATLGDIIKRLEVVIDKNKSNK